MKYIDLTHTITDNMPVFPGNTTVRLQPTVTYQKDGVANHLLQCSLHTGTHIDAPGHFTEHDKKITDFPISKFVGNATIINVKDAKTIRIDNVHGKIKQNDIVLFYTGFDKYFYKPNYFQDYPIIEEECAQYLVDNNIKMVGVDFPSVVKVPYNANNLK